MHSYNFFIKFPCKCTRSSSKMVNTFLFSFSAGVLLYSGVKFNKIAEYSFAVSRGFDGVLISEIFGKFNGLRFAGDLVATLVPRLTLAGPNTLSLLRRLIFAFFSTVIKLFILFFFNICRHCDGVGPTGYVGYLVEHVPELIEILLVDRLHFQLFKLHSRQNTEKLNWKCLKFITTLNKPT